MNRNRFCHLFGGLVVGVVTLVVSFADAQSIAVIDVKTALESYHRKDVELERVRQVKLDKTKVIDNLNASYQNMTKQMVRLDDLVRSNRETERARKDAQSELLELAELRNKKARDIKSVERKLTIELTEMQKLVEDALLADIAAGVKVVVAARGFDLVFDRSYLPRETSKVILYASPRVSDITNDVINHINSKQVDR